MKHDINAWRRSYFIHQVNEPIVKAINLISKGTSALRLLSALIEIAWDIKKYPDPTPENVVHPNSKWLLQCLDQYLQYERFDRIAAIVKVLVKVMVVKLEHSPNYADRISWWVETTPKGWKGRSLNHPRNGWAEPRPYGGRK